MIGAKYRDRGRGAVNMSSRNISSERRSKSILNRKKPVSAGTLPQKTRSSKDEDTVKSATKSRGIRGRRLLSRRENKMVRDDVKHQVCLSDETSVVSAGNNDPIYILRKEIHDWRVSGQLTDRFERDCRLIEDETEKSSVQENRETIVKDLLDPDVLHELPSSTAIDHLTRRTENSSSPETCNDRVCSTTSPGEMTSVRTCYCKHEENVARRKDNDIRIHNANRHPVTVVSKKSIVTNATCGSGRESCKRASRVINERTLDTHRSVEVQPSNSILSPETSTALENAEKIVNNAKIQLMEVCATSTFDSAQQHRNTYLDEPPLDDEMEERLYVRELVASKFQDACSSKLSEAKMSARSEKCDFPRVTVRRIDLLAPKFRMSRRRRADWSSLGYGSDNRSRGRASPAQVLSKNSINNVNVDTAARDDRARDRRRILSARGNECEIQIGPSVHIVDRELVKQDLEDVHISPEPYPAQSRANTATYILHHDVIQTNADNRMNDPEVSGTPRTRCVRLDTLQRGKPIEKPITTEATTETIPVTPVTKFEKEFEDAKNSNAGQDVERFQSPKVRNFRQEKKNPDSQDVEKTPECLRNTTSQGATKFAQIDKNEKLHKARNENHEGILFLSSAGGDTRIHYAEDDGIFCKRSADHQRNVENIVDKIQVEENRSDRSKLSPGDDISRIADFPRQRENIASRCRQTESSRPHRTNDRHFSHKFNSHNGQDGLNIINEDVQCQSSASGCTDVFQETIFAEDNLDDIDLYRPCLDDFDSILHSNDKKIEHVTRVIRNFSELLSDSKFTIYKLDEDELVPQDAKFCRNSLNDKDGECPLNEAARSSLLETELRNEDLTISKVHQTDDLQAANAAGTKSSAFTKEDGSRSNYSKNSVESSVFPASDANDSPRTSRDSDRTQRSATKAYLLESSMDRSDATTFSNLVPTLSSTHTEAHHQKKEVARDDRDKVTSAKKFSEHKIRRSRKKYTDDRIFAQFFQKDTSQAADRFLAYILQDEKRSIEGKIASALKESAITPAAVQKLLDHLREAESIRDARQSETLDILRNILINVKNQSDQGNANDKKLFFQNVSDSLARSNAPPNAIDESREQSVQQTPVKIDGNEVEQNFAKKSYELKGLGEHSSDLSECRETRESVRSTARCVSTQHFANSKDIGQTENADVVRTVSVDKNQTDKDINENNPKKEEIFPRNVTGSLIRSNATSNANEETILRIKNNTNDTGQVTGKSNDSKNPDKYFSPAIPESRESVHSVVHFETAKNSKNNSKNNKNNNSNENSCSEAESLKQISDIRSDDNENPEENSEHLSTKIASVRSKGGSEMETVDLVTGISVSKNKDDIIIEKLEDGKSQEVVQIDKNQRTNEIVTQADQVIEARSNIPEAVKEITNGITQDNTTSAGKRVLFTLAEVSETKNGRVCSDVSPAKSKFIDEDVTKGDIGLIHLSAKENTGSLREAKIDFQQKMIKQKNADNNCSAESPRDCALPKNSESSSREVASCNKQISFDIAGKDNSTRDMRNEETCKLMTLAVVENRRDGNEISKPQKIATSDNERQLIDLTSISRKYKIDVLSSSNSSVSSTLLDHDDRSTNGALSADTRRAETTPETSHSEGELYMPSSCSYSLGEVRILRRKHDLIENNMMDRDSSMTVLVTKSMLTSLNDSTMSLLGSSERI